LLWKSNSKSYVVCRMAPFLMTLDDPNCRNCFGYICDCFKANYFRKYASGLREVFRIGNLSGIDDCCQMGLRSLKGRFHGNHFLIQSTVFFRHSDQCKINFVQCAFIHDGLDRRKCNTRGRPSTISVDSTSIPGNGH